MLLLLLSNSSYKKIISNWSISDKSFLRWKKDCYLNKEMCPDWSKNCTNNGIYLVKYTENSKEHGLEFEDEFYICKSCFDNIKKSVGKPL